MWAYYYNAPTLVQNLWIWVRLSRNMVQWNVGHLCRFHGNRTYCFFAKKPVYLSFLPLSLPQTTHEIELHPTVHREIINAVAVTENKFTRTQTVCAACIMYTLHAYNNAYASTPSSEEGGGTRCNGVLFSKKANVLSRFVIELWDYDTLGGSTVYAFQ